MIPKGRVITPPGSAPTPTPTTTLHRTGTPPAANGHASPVTGYTVLHAMKLPLYEHYKPKPYKRNIDFDGKAMRPVVCKTLDDFQRLPDECRMSISLLGYGRGKKGEPPRPKPNGDPFFEESPRFIGPSPKQLLELYRRLPLAHRNLCLLVQGDCGVHFYADLDEKHGKRNPVQVRAAFQNIVSACFRRDFPGREFDWTDTQWFQAHNPAKFSEHVHVRSQVWKSLGAMRGWIQGSLLPFVQQQARKGNEDALLLGTLTDQPNQMRPTWHGIIDDGVYNDMRNFRLYLQCKPGGTPLQAVVPIGETKQSADEYLFRTLPTYAITAPEDRWCDWQYAGKFKRDGGGSGGGGGKSGPKGPSSGGGGGCVSNTGRASDYAWMSKVRIPWFDTRGWPQPVVVGTGFFQKDGSPYVRYDRDTPCTHCSTMKDKRVCHGSNWSYLTLTDGGELLNFRSWDPDCRDEGERFPVPPEAYGTLGALPKHMREFVLYLRNLPADGPQWTPKPLAPVRLVRPTARQQLPTRSTSSNTNGMVQHEQKHDRPTPMVLDTDNDGPSPDAAGFSVGANVDDDDDTHMADDEDEEANRRRPVRPVDMMQAWIKRHKSGGCSSSTSTSSKPVSPDG